MSAPEHTLFQGELGQEIEDIILFDAALNLNGATARLIYSAPESDTKTDRSASIVGLPSFDAATSCSFQRATIDLDTDVVGIFNYQWKLTLAGGEVFYYPRSAPTEQFPYRKFPCFEVVESVDQFTEVSDAGSPISTQPIIPLDDIAALKALPKPINGDYKLVIVESDWNGNQASFWFDATIVADNPANGEVVLTAGGGGFRKKA
jgi:hypothetical protein